MDRQIAAAKARALGVLSEKESATPECYPLSMNALVNACNRKSNYAAIMCVLRLRGPQTPGELRGRAERLFQFDDPEAVERTLQHPAEMEWIWKLPRQAGSRESRFAHLFSGDVEFDAAETETAVRGAAPGALDRIAALEAQLAELRREFDAFRKGFE